MTLLVPTHSVDFTFQGYGIAHVVSALKDSMKDSLTLLVPLVWPFPTLFLV